ncbi:MMS19 nucleotide excision repair [Chlorella sorokiniana]|uniref:RING-type E3 ubiquitin transferase n=1 Tax=Chlorella sorokiniana TaxID=3076 RepID=A0A2P6TD63_CHLSO|nr:MMS19 nucleotide excision repair [Chlorella sorokiniana]|eukprot:PRW20581.1 MMS19 nucleotide excision repair [Chlorella sorokiniana]
MTSSRLTRSRAASQDSQQAGTAAAAEDAVHLPAPSAAAAAATAAAISEAGPSRRKRPLDSHNSHALSEDDYSCPICLNLLLDPVVGACGHDCCELCFRRWTVDQGKRSCPVCRAALAGGPAAPLPGVCLRLQRTLEQLFPERTKERHAELAEQKRQLAAEKRQREEETRRAAAAREAASADSDRLMHALLEHLLHEHAMGLGSLVNGGGGAQRAQQAAQAQQQVQQAQQAQQQAQPTDAEQRLAQQLQAQHPGSRRNPSVVRALAAEMAEQAASRPAQADPGARHQAVPPQSVPAGGSSAAAAAAAAAGGQEQQQMQQQQVQPGRMGRLLSSVQSLFGGRGRGAPGAAPSQQQQAAAGQPGAGQPAPGRPAVPRIEVQFVHLVSRQGQAGPPQMQAQVTHLEIPMDALGLPPGLAQAAAAAAAGPAPAGPAAAAAAGGARGGGTSGDDGSPGSAAWPEGPPLDDMHFEMGWGEQNRRRRGSRGSRNSGGGSGSGRR